MASNNDFDRSAFMKQLHAKARARRELYQQLGGDPERYGRFLAKDNPVDKYITAYDVSYQLSYRGETGGLFIQPETFTVYTIRGPETDNDIYQRTKDMVIDMKGTKTGDNLPPSSREKLQDDVSVFVNPRGLERNEEKRFDLDIYKGLQQGGYHLEKLDTEVKLKNSKGRESKVRLDMTHFRRS